MFFANKGLFSFILLTLFCWSSGFSSFDKFNFIFDISSLRLNKSDSSSSLVKLSKFIECRDIIKEKYKVDYDKNIGFDKMYKDMIKNGKIYI